MGAWSTPSKSNPERVYIYHTFLLFPDSAAAGYREFLYHRNQVSNAAPRRMPSFITKDCLPTFRHGKHDSQLRMKIRLL